MTVTYIQSKDPIRNVQYLKALMQPRQQNLFESFMEKNLQKFYPEMLDFQSTSITRYLSQQLAIVQYNCPISPHEQWKSFSSGKIRPSRTFTSE